MPIRNDEQWRTLIASAADPGAGDLAGYLRAARALDRLDPAAVAAAPRLRVAMLGSFTMQPLETFLRVEAARLGTLLDVHTAAYGTYWRELQDPHAATAAFAPAVTFVVLDADVLWQMRWADVGAWADELKAALIGFAARVGGLVVVNDFVPPRAAADALIMPAGAGPAAFGTQLVNAAIAAACEQAPNLRVFPFSELVLDIGRERAFDRKAHYRGHVSWSTLLATETARRYAGIVRAAQGHATKCIVLDLDNTLWGGVLGEDGPDGIAIGPHWPGAEYLDFQRQLLALQQSGVLLAVVSKNDEAAALDVLERHRDMLIRPAHLAAWRIGWQDKATSIAEIARELELSPAHFLFIDDSPAERAWVRQQLPDVAVPEVPVHPGAYADWIATLPSLALIHRSAHDADRTAQYQEARLRAEYKTAAGDEDAFIEGLQLTAAVGAVESPDIPRVVQLLLRTNQFNLTTRRHDEATLRSRLASGTWRAYTLRAADRFGASGLTGAAIVEPRGESWHVDSFVLSCRVLGRRLERCLLAAIAADARRGGARTLTAEFLPTERNAVASSFLPDQGFLEQSPGQFTAPLEPAAFAWPAAIHVVSEDRHEPTCAAG